MNTKILLAATLSFSLLTPAPAQQPQPRPADNPQEDVVRVTSNLTQVDVVVVDKNDRQVTDLAPEDFEVLEDGKRQQITNFSYVAVNAPPPSGATAEAAGERNAPRIPPAPLRPEHVRRTVALVVDDLGLSFQSVSFVKEALRRFVEEQMQPGDQVAIIRTGGDAGALQQLTNDKEQLRAVIDKLRWNPGGRGGLSPMPTITNQKEALSMNENGPDNQAMADIRRSGEMIEELEMTRADHYAVGSFGSLGFVIQGMSQLPGRKSVVFISEAFRLFSKQGRNNALKQALDRLVEQANQASTVIYTLDASGLQDLTLTASDKVTGGGYLFDKGMFQEGGSGGRNTPGNQPLGQRASDAFSQSTEGLRRLGALADQRAQAQVQSHSVLSMLAEGTGGFLVSNRNDLGSGLRKIVDDQRGYYLIGYRPDDATIDPATGRRRVRELTVKVKRSGLRVRNRPGSYTVSLEGPRTSKRTREEQLAAVLTSPFATNEVDVRLTSLFGDEQAAGTYVRSLVSIDANDLTFEKAADGAHKASIDMAGALFGEGGRVVEQFAHTQTIALGEADYRQALQNSLVYNFDFPVKQAGAYQLRLAVRDAASERAGSARQFVEVPDVKSGKLALSGIILKGTVPPPATAGTNGAAPPAAAEDPQAGPNMRRLRQGMLLDYRYAVYNAQPDPATNRPQVTTQMRLFRDGKPVFTGRVLPLDASQQPDMKRLGAGGRLRLGPDLTPGSYVLQVVVEDTRSKEKLRTATQWIDFEIVN
ncbi:MAG TPA: VWA domain-containing protein [Pyrinomonadaceae bacterium]|nr:VWA domain-containing protein [Pyrinomonadaceae bacterium]